MTWTGFFAWLEKNGIRYCNGDMHYEGRGYWYPAPPDITRNVIAPRPPPPWVHVFESSVQDEVLRAGRWEAGPVIQTVNISTSWGVDHDVQDPKEAQAVVSQAMADFDLQLGADPLIPIRVRQQQSQQQPEPAKAPFYWPPRDYTGKHTPTYGPRQGPPKMRPLVARGGNWEGAPIIKDCKTCGREYTPQRWADLPLLGVQKIEADDEGPACEYTAKNCPCGSTLYVEQDLPAKPLKGYRRR